MIYPLNILNGYPIGDGTLGSVPSTNKCLQKVAKSKCAKVQNQVEVASNATVGSFMLHGLHIHFALGQLLLFDSVLRLCRVGFPRGGSTGKDHANGLRAVSLLNRSHLQTALKKQSDGPGNENCCMESCCSLSFSLRHIQFDC